jgi:DNA-binding NarL/FixJ family response regulator
MLYRIAGIDVVALARDVPEAREYILGYKPDVLILDIHLPGGSGIDLLREAKQNQPNTLVIVLTNHPYPQYREKCIELGADYFFTKSVASSTLIEVCVRLSKLKRDTDQ